MEKHNIPQAKQPYGCHTIHWEYNKIIQLVVLEIKQQVVRDRILVYGLATNIQVGYILIISSSIGELQWLDLYFTHFDPLQEILRFDPKLKKIEQTQHSTRV